MQLQVQFQVQPQGQPQVHPRVQLYLRLVYISFFVTATGSHGGAAHFTILMASKRAKF